MKIHIQDKEKLNRAMIAFGCLCLIISMILPGNAVASLKADSIRKLDEYGDLLWQDERPRLDNLYTQLSNQPNDIAYIIVYAGRRTCRGLAQARARRARNYLVNVRGIQTERVVIMDGGHRENLTTELFAQPRDAQQPMASPTVDSREIQVRDCRANNRRRSRRR